MRIGGVGGCSMKVVVLLTRLVAVLVCYYFLDSFVHAQQFPSKIVKLLVPQAPGGATDVFARKIGQLLSERWGQSVIVENRAGAAGIIGTNDVAKSTADGYTLFVTYAGSQAVNPSKPLSQPTIRFRQGLSASCDSGENPIFSNRQSEASCQ
jgi:tripartite-type tricarboxylate transporter receptor subunit TctC